MFPTLPALPVKLQSKVNGELRPGESIIWSGQPIPYQKNAPAVRTTCVSGWLNR